MLHLWTFLMPYKYKLYRVSLGKKEFRSGKHPPPKLEKRKTR
jgi:hypothetical protein